MDKVNNEDAETVVVEQLPQVQQTEAIGADGKKYIFKTRDEAIAEILEIVKKLEGKL